MKVTLVSHTQDAKDLLIFTKQTRLNMSADGLAEIANWDQERKDAELEYMANTIKSSWEFVDYTFMIEGVSRGFTHQFVRNRTGSYAQQTMRILDMADFSYVTGPTIENNQHALELYCDTMTIINSAYQELLGMEGVKIEDARGILPTNICTNIVAKYNLRTMSDLCASRSSPRTQGEFRLVLEQMYEEITKVHPWAKAFLKGNKAESAALLDAFIAEHATGTQQTDLWKLVDALRK